MTHDEVIAEIRKLPRQDSEFIIGWLIAQVVDANTQLEALSARLQVVITQLELYQKKVTIN